MLIFKYVHKLNKINGYMVTWLHGYMVRKIKNNEAQISCNKDMLLKITLVNYGIIEEKKGWYCPEFGKKYECTVLEYNMSRANNGS